MHDDDQKGQGKVEFSWLCAVLSSRKKDCETSIKKSTRQRMKERENEQTQKPRKEEEAARCEQSRTSPLFLFLLLFWLAELLACC